MKKWCVVLIMSFLAIANSFGQNDQQFYFQIDGTTNADTETVTLRSYSDYRPKNAEELVGKVNYGKITILRQVVGLNGGAGYLS